jgi:hypothetical protein
LNNSLDIVRLILIILFGGYELWAFGKKKSVKRKFIPLVSMIVFGMLMAGVAAFSGIGTFLFIFVILIIELSLIGAIIVVLIELCLTLFTANHNFKKVMILAVVFIVLVVVYYLGEKVF